MENDLITKWAKYYEDNGLQWLASQHVAAIKQAFFAGAEAVEQSVQRTGCALCGHPLNMHVDGSLGHQYQEPIARR